MIISNNYIFQWKVLYPQHFLQYFHKNYNKILCGMLLLVLIWTHNWNYFFTHLVNNNLLFKIYCKNIVVTFLNCHFLFFILFFLSISSIPSSFFLLFFVHHTRIPILAPFLFLFYMIPDLSLSLSTFSFSTWF